MRASQSISIIVSQVTEYFPYSPELIALCNKINNSGFISAKLNVLNAPHEGSLEDLAKWKNDIDKRVQSTSDNEYDKPISDLLDYLSTQLSEP